MGVVLSGLKFDELVMSSIIRKLVDRLHNCVQKIIFLSTPNLNFLIAAKNYSAFQRFVLFC